MTRFGTSGCVILLALAGAVGCGERERTMVMADGGFPGLDAGPGTDAGADGGLSDGGATDGGASDAGVTDGGATDGGATDGGATDAGPGDGGAGDGGRADGGPDGGATDAGPVEVVLRIDTLGATGCNSVDHDAVTGDDHGGVAVSGSSVFVVGDDATGIYDLDLASGVPIASDPPALVDNARDVMVSDVGSGGAFLLADDTGPLGLLGALPRGTATLTRLLPMGADGAPTTGEVVLSMPIALDASLDVGLFAGRGEIGIHDGSLFFVIDTATGAVTELGLVTLPPPSTCENWAYWGLLERVGATRSVVFVQSGGLDPNELVRVDVPSGAVSPLPSLGNLDDMCSIAADTMRGRWYFHHEFSSDLVTTGSEILGYCDATYALSGSDFAVTELAGTGCMGIDGIDTLIGDDRGGIAMRDGSVFLAGDDGLGRWDGALGMPATSAANAIVYEGIFSNIATGDVWSLADAGGALVSIASTTVTRLVKLDPDTGFATREEIALSRPIDVLTDNLGIFAGWDEVLLHDGARVWRVALTDGAVTDLGAMTMPTYEYCETNTFWGIAENFGGKHYLAYVNANAIIRVEVPTAAQTTIATFTDLSDMCSFTLSAARDRWYFHHEYGSQLAPGDPEETLGFCPATLSHR
jgi:hypothetical protein